MTTRQVSGNCLLAALPAAVEADWRPHMEEISLPEGHVLCGPGQALSHVYFPTTAIVSWQYVLATGDCTEIAMVGREGLVGLYLLMGVHYSNNQAVVHTAGKAIQIKLDVVLRSFRRVQDVQRQIMLFAQAMISQMSQGNVCRQHHTLEQQLSRMLLMILERQEGVNIDKTHESLAQLLGVRREGVSLAAAKLMKEGVLSYSRGRIRVLNLDGLMKHSCECYRQLRQQYQPLLKCPNSVLHTQTETI
jgi:CRP-like cAMP-binding protein